MADNKGQEKEVMELSDYISLTLSEIAKGVQKATGDYEKLGGGQVLSGIQAPIDGMPTIRICGQKGGDIYKPIIKVAFRVGVQVESSEKSNNKLKGSLQVISAGHESLSKDEKRNTHEVSFELPLLLPQKK